MMSHFQTLLSMGSTYRAPCSSGHVEVVYRYDRQAVHGADAVGLMAGPCMCPLVPCVSAQPEIPVLWSFVTETPPNSFNRTC